MAATQVRFGVSAVFRKASFLPLGTIYAGNIVAAAENTLVFKRMNKKHVRLLYGRLGPLNATTTTSTAGRFDALHA